MPLHFFLGVFQTTQANELNFMYSGQSFKFPSPIGYCFLGKSRNEQLIFDWQADIQNGVGNTLYAVAIDCDIKNSIASGADVDGFDNWVLITALRLGKNKSESLLRGMTNEQFLEMMAKYMGGNEFNFSEQSLDKMQKNISKANKEFLGDGALMKLRNAPVELGVLGVSDSIRYGMVMKYEFQTGPEIVAVVSSLTSIKQIPIAFHFYSTFEDDSTITNLIEKVSKYSTAFHRAN